VRLVHILSDEAPLAAHSERRQVAAGAVLPENMHEQLSRECLHFSRELGSLEQIRALGGLRASDCARTLLGNFALLGSFALLGRFRILFDGADATN